MTLILKAFFFQMKKTISHLHKSMFEICYFIKTLNIPITSKVNKLETLINEIVNK